MFWNLVRYEFKNVNKWYLALYGAVLAISVLIGAFINSLSPVSYTHLKDEKTEFFNQHGV